jgi:sugar phosphate isomerase/epimerase
VDLCLYTDSVPNLTLDEVLDFAVDVGARAVEIAAGGQSAAPHMRVFELLDNASKRAEFADKISSRGLRLAAVNCSAWPMHPRYGDEHLELIRASIRLASELGVDKIVTMSGCPGESATGRTINWITIPWPPDMYALLEEQWQVALGVWRDLADFASACGIRRIALELHPLQLVYNVPTLRRLREEIGPLVGANVDPSHMFWQQMDPVSVIGALGPAVHHVHLKDLEMCQSEVALAGVLDSRPFSSPDRRAWIFRTIGQGHPADFWSAFLRALREVGYDDVLSIENEDPTQPEQDGVTQAAAFVADLFDAEERLQGSRQAASRHSDSARQA